MVVVWFSSIVTSAKTVLFVRNEAKCCGRDDGRVVVVWLWVDACAFAGKLGARSRGSYDALVVVCVTPSGMETDLCRSKLERLLIGPSRRRSNASRLVCEVRQKRSR